jgi:RNase P subunit RPR2
MISAYKVCSNCKQLFKEDKIMRIRLPYNEWVFKCVKCKNYKEEVPM